MLNGLLVALVVVVLAKEPGRVHVETEGSTGVAIVGTVKVLDQHVGDLVGLVALVTTGIQEFASNCAQRENPHQLTCKSQAFHMEIRYRPLQFQSRNPGGQE